MEHQSANNFAYELAENQAVWDAPSAPPPVSINSDLIHAEINRVLAGSLPHEVLDEKDRHGRAYLHHAVLLGDVRLVADLIEAGAKCDIADVQGATPYNLACDLRERTIMHMLADAIKLNHTTTRAMVGLKAGGAV